MNTDRPVRDTAHTFCMIVNVGTFLDHAIVRAYPFHLTLCAQILANGDYAAAMYRFADRHDTRLILDNGAHEENLIDDNTYIQIITNLLPDVIVLPDLVGAPAYDSRCRSLSFAKRIFHEIILRTRPEYVPQIMYVVQGNSPGDVQMELTWINVGGLRNAMYAIWQQRLTTLLGIGQVYLQYCFDDDERDTEVGRSRFFNDMTTADTGGISEYAVHVLGGRWSPLPIEVLTAHHNIVGLDSVKPLTCTFNAVAFTSNAIPSLRKIDLLSLDSFDPIDRYIHNMIRFSRAYNLVVCPTECDVL